MSTRPTIVTGIFGGTGRHKPDDVKKAQGTFRPDRAKPEANYSKVGPEFEPVAPEWMRDPQAKTYYEEAFCVLRDAGILAFADISLLEIWAAERAAIQRRYDQMYTLVENEDGSTGYKVDPGMGPGTEKLNAFRMLCSELGFSPVARHKVGPGNKKPKGEKDEWGDM